MMNVFSKGLQRWGGVVLSGLVCGIGSAETASGKDQAALERLFTLKVAPMLEEKCVGCHGEPGKKLKGGLDVSTRAAFLRGGDEIAHSLVPGDVKKASF